MKLGSGYVIHRIGPKLRAYRKEKGLRLIDLTSSTGVSSAMLSKIENGRIIPTIPTLFQLISALKIEPHDFFAEISENGKFHGYIAIRKENFVTYVKEESAVGFHYQSIFEHTLPTNDFQISIVTLDPSCERPLVKTSAFEFLYIIEGEIRFNLNETLIDLRSGDALFFDGRIPHVPTNPHGQPANYIVIYFFVSDDEADIEITD